ncbi:HEAT repeat domain-containing protein [Blastopirellula marina]|uniref:HEAT repeat domain-containing protein n=1 Tax=Blastopirellula marina TaxID=124 RepID=UPI001E58EFA3|nr:HEAT repeat domain-containing protein [Blastopirellula marina]
MIDQVYQETRRLAVAGSNLAADDFRLKKLIPLLRKAAEKAPVFGKLADSAESLLSSPATQSADKLLELSSMVTAILYTQGQTGIEGKLASLPKTELEFKPTRTGARALKPLLDALTTTGPGRLEIIRDAAERGLFNDLRLVSPAIAAIDDPYAEIGDLVTDKILPIYGPTIYPLLRSGFDPKGKGGAARRLRRMHKIDPEGTHALVEESLESGSKEVKLAALACLKGNKRTLDLLLGQASSRTKDIRLAALRSLAEMDAPEVITVLTQALNSADAGEIAPLVSRNRSKKLKGYLLAEIERLLDEALNTSAAKKRETALNRLGEILPALKRDQEKGTIAFLTRCYDEKDNIAKLKGKATDGNDILGTVGSLITACGNKPLQKRLVDDVDSLGIELFIASFQTSLQICKPAEIFTKFSPYYQGDKKQRKTKEAEKNEILRSLLEHVASPHAYHYYHYLPGTAIQYDQENQPEAKLDDRWLDLAVEHQDLEMVHILARPKHKPTQAFLADAFQKSLKQKSWYHEAHLILETMLTTSDPNATASVVTAIEKLNQKDTGSIWWFSHLLQNAPPETVAAIEAMLPQLNEKLVDALVPYLTETKART